MLLIREFFDFILHILKSKKLLLTLIIYTFKKNYLGSYLGLAWAFIQPLTFVFIIWAVFGLGFRSHSTNSGAPFVIWLLAGMVPWFFISDAIRSGADSISNNGYLIRKVAFRTSILPLVNIGSSLLIHFGMLLFLVIALLLHGFLPTIFWLQLPFYIILTSLLAVGFSWLTSSISVFMKDMKNLVSIGLQLGFWLTPIFWSLNVAPAKYHYLVKINPAFYIIDGYRDTFIDGIWFWEKPAWSFYYLAITGITFSFGALVFKRLRPHFADVL